MCACNLGLTYLMQMKSALLPMRKCDTRKETVKSVTWTCGSSGASKNCSQPWTVLLPRGHGPLSGDTFGYHTWKASSGETKNAAKHLTMYRRVHCNKELSGPKCKNTSNAKVKMLCPCLGKHLSEENLVAALGTGGSWHQPGILLPAICSRDGQTEQSSGPPLLAQGIPLMF